MVWRSDGPQGSEAQKVALDIVQYFHGRCLDLGCGPRKVFPARHVIGIDNNKDAVLFGSVANPDIPASCDKLEMFADRSIDTVFSSHLLEHIDDYKAALAEWWRVIRPGGYLVLYLPHADWYPNIGMPGANPDHKHDFRPDDITRVMESIGWRSGCGWTQEVDEVRSLGLEYSFLQVYKKRATGTCTRWVPEPMPEKSLGLVRLGAYGDALWITTVLPALRKQYDHITLYTQPQGEVSLRHDPNIDRMVVQPTEIFGSDAAQLQALYWLHCERKHHHFINLVGCVERHLLPHPSDPNFYMPFEQRGRLMNRNYFEAVAEWAGVEFDSKTVRVKFTPSAEEMAWAAERRAKTPGSFVMISPSGSSMSKYWPHAQEAMTMLAEAGIGGVLVGDLRGKTYEAPAGWEVIGQTLDLRKVYTLAALADVVIGTESAVLNSVAHEAPLKIALLSHSTAQNLTRDWSTTIALEPEGLACYPCHRIHQDWKFCSLVEETGASACQHAATAEIVTGYALQWIRGELKEAA